MEQSHCNTTGNPFRTVDPAGRVTELEYDILGNITRRTLPKPTPSSPAPVYITEYDHLGRPIANIDPLGNRTQTVYGDFSRVAAVLDALNNRTEYTYNRIGEVIQIKDPMQRITQFIYDNLGRRVQTILPKPAPSSANPILTTIYNPIGLVFQEIDPLGNATTMEYDGLGRLITTIDAEGGRTEFTYDDEGKLLSLKDPVNNVTSYNYDDAGRVTMETIAAGVRRVDYLAGWLIAKRTDRNGRYVTFDYDRFSRKISEKWYEANDTFQRTLTFTYDILGRLTNFIDPDSKFTYTYDDGDRNVLTIMQLTGLPTPIRLDRTFDLADQQRSVAAKVGTTDDFINRYEYDASGNPTSITQEVSSVPPKRVTYAYNAASQPTLKMVYASLDDSSKIYDTTFGYDGMGRMSLLKHANGSTIFANYDLGWDAKRLTNFDITPLSQMKKTASYGYDDTDQLTAADYNFQTDESYTYDANGNRANYGLGANNRVTYDGNYTYIYDNEGNVTSKNHTFSGEITTYQWDHRNRLVKVTSPDAIVEYAYDHANRLIRRNNLFVIHDGTEIALILNPSGSINHRMFWGRSIDELIAEEKSSAVSWTLTDHLGSVRDILDSTGTVVNHLEYNAFGVLTSQTNLTPAPLFRYTGKPFDAATNLQYNVNRWYDANTGRWLSEDPIGFMGKDANLYRYVRNNASMLIDPSGKVVVIGKDGRKALIEWLDAIGIVKDIHYKVTKSRDGKERIFKLIPNPEKKYDYQGKVEYEIAYKLMSGNSISECFFIGGNDGDSIMLNWKYHITARIKVVKAAKKFKNTFGGFPEGYWFNPEYLSYYYGDTPMSIYDFVNTVYNNESFSVGCTAAVHVIMGKGVIDALRSHGKSDEDIRDEMEERYGGFRPDISPDYHIPGDQLFIQNKLYGEYLEKKREYELGVITEEPKWEGGATQGENLIYLGNGIYFGHLPKHDGKNKRKYEEWIALVNSWSEKKGYTIGPDIDFPFMGLKDPDESE